MLGMLEVEGAQAFLTETGRDWYTADIQTSKQMFAKLASTRAPLVRTIVKALQNSHDGGLRDDFFRDLLRRGFSEEDTENNSTSPSTGAATESFSTTTPTPVNSSLPRSTPPCGRKPRTSREA